MYLVRYLMDLLFWFSPGVSMHDVLQSNLAHRLALGPDHFYWKPRYTRSHHGPVLIIALHIYPQSSPPHVIKCQPNKALTKSSRLAPVV